MHNAMKKRSAWTCWGSGVKFSHRNTFGRWRSYDRTYALRTLTMQENQLLREKKKKTTFSVFVSTPSNAVHALWRRLPEVETLPIGLSHDRTTRRSAPSIARWNMKHFPVAVTWSHCSCTALRWKTREQCMQSMDNAREPSTWPRPCRERKL